MSALTQALLLQAQRYAQAGDARAGKAFALVLENDAFNLEARTFLAREALANGQAETALEHLTVAVHVAPNKAALWRSLGLAQMACQHLPEAEASFTRCLQLNPALHVARLHLGKAQEQQGRRDAATRTYLQALSAAQRAGHWLDQASTPPWLQDDVAHAAAVADAGRREIFDTLMQPLFARFGKTALRRVELAVQGMLGLQTVRSQEPRQQPTFLYFPDLPSTPVFDPALFPWFSELEARFGQIQGEAEQLLHEGLGKMPFLALGSEDRADDYLGGEQPAWDACFFYRHGQRFDANHAAYPQTSKALEALPLVRIEQHAPEICFSILAPGTHILPHYGTSNIRSVVHLPLIVPEQCALKVLDTEIAGLAGRCFAFDDTFLHEAWNRSTQARVILLMDAWNPHLHDVEKTALAEIVASTGHWNQA